MTMPPSSSGSFERAQSHYQEVAPYLLPYLKGRALSLARFSTEGRFYLHRRKDLSKVMAESLDLLSDDLITCSDSETLLKLLLLPPSEDGGMGVFMWPSSLNHRECPDWVCWQLVGGKNVSFAQVCEAGHALVALLEEPKENESADGTFKKIRPVFIKTSDLSGLDVVIPTDGLLSYEEANRLAIQKAEALIRRHSGELKLLKTPEGLSSEAENYGKIGVYTGSNQWGRGIIAPYSLTLNQYGVCSVPLRAEELKDELRQPELTKQFRLLDFTSAMLKERLDREGDLWKDLLI